MNERAQAYIKTKTEHLRKEFHRRTEGGEDPAQLVGLISDGKGEEFGPFVGFEAACFISREQAQGMIPLVEDDPDMAPAVDLLRRPRDGEVPVVLFIDEEVAFTTLTYVDTTPKDPKHTMDHPVHGMVMTAEGLLRWLYTIEPRDVGKEKYREQIVRFQKRVNVLIDTQRTLTGRAPVLDEVLAQAVNVPRLRRLMSRGANTGRGVSVDELSAVVFDGWARA